MLNQLAEILETQSDIELHFQEGFAGESIDIHSGALMLATVQAKTKYQTGLATIITLPLEDATELSIRVNEAGPEATIKVDFERPFITIAMIDNDLQLALTATRPGYL